MIRELGLARDLRVNVFSWQKKAAEGIYQSLPLVGNGRSHVQADMRREGRKRRNVSHALINTDTPVKTEERCFLPAALFAGL